MKTLLIAACVSFIAISGMAYAESLYLVDVESRPLGFPDSDGTPTGVAIEIINLVVENLGHEVTIEFQPGKRVLKALQDGDADGVPFIYKTPQREEFLDYCTEPLLLEQIVFYVKKDNVFPFEGDFDQIQAKPIGTIAGYTYGEKFNTAAPNLNVKPANSLEQSLEMLLKERVEVVVGSTLRASRVIKEMGADDQIVQHPYIIEEIPTYVAFSKVRNLTHIRDQFDAELSRMITDGTIAKIVAKWH